MFEVTNGAPGPRTFQVKAGDAYKDKDGRDVQPVRTVTLQPGTSATLDLVGADHPAVTGMLGVTIRATKAAEPTPEMNEPRTPELDRLTDEELRGFLKDRGQDPDGRWGREKLLAAALKAKG